MDKNVRVTLFKAFTTFATIERDVRIYIYINIYIYIGESVLEPEIMHCFEIFFVMEDRLRNQKKKIAAPFDSPFLYFGTSAGGKGQRPEAQRKQHLVCKDVNFLHAFHQPCFRTLALSVAARKAAPVSQPE